MDDIHESLNVSMGTANMVGVLLSTMTFGVHLTLFADLNRLYFGWMGARQQWRPSRHDWRLLAYVYVLFLLSTSGLCLQTWVTHDAFVVHGTFPGGPLAYLAQRTRHPIHVTMTAIYIFVNWFADGMLLYRAYVLSKYHKCVVIMCVLTLMSLIGMGGYFIHTISVDGINLWTSCELTPCITYLSLSFAINLVFTVGIIWRLVYVRREISGGSLGREVARVYTSILAMLIESASLYTIVALLAIIACARRIPMQDALLPMLGQLQAIPPLMITLRVMEGRAVTWETWHNPAISRKSPSLNFTSVIPPTFLGSTAKVDIEFDSSYSSNRFSRIYISSSGEAKESSIMDWDVPPCAGPVSERPTKLWICTDLHGFASGSITAVDEENGCGLSGDPNPFPPSPQSPPIAFTPRNSTATDLSRTIWTHV